MDRSQQAGGTRGRRGIRGHLFQVQLISVIPIGVFATALLYLHWQVQEQQRERSQVQSVRILAAAVDNALDSTIERLGIFARLWSSAALDETAIHAHAEQALAANADWESIVAFAADGRRVFRSDSRDASERSTTPPFELWSPVLRERRPVISDVVIPGPGGARPAVAIGVPVLDSGRVSHVLIVNLDLRWYDALLDQQRQPEGGVAALLDGAFRFVARSAEGDQRRGRDPTGALVQDMRQQREGVGRYTNLNGTEVFTAWTFTRHGWGLGFATPSAPIDAAFWDHLLLFAVLWGGALGGGTLYASRKARPIVAARIRFSAGPPSTKISLT